MFRTEPGAFPTEAHIPLRARIFSQWLPASGYALADAPEVQIIHWYPRPHKGERYIEILIPIERPN